MISRLLCALGCVAALTASSAHAAALPPVKHVFIIVLENQDYEKIFGPATVAPYLGHELPAKGAMLNNYYATGHASLGNYITLISGQPQANATIADCRVYVDFTNAGAPPPIDSAASPPATAASIRAR